MARNTQLVELLDQLRSELRQSKNPAAGVNSDDTYKRALRTAQEFLYMDYDWSFLYGWFDVDVEAGSQYYDLPCQPQSIKSVHFKWNNIWHPLKWGISVKQLNSMDPDQDQRADPVTHIDYYGANQYRVWPLPATDGGTVRFDGKAALTNLVTNANRALLDDLLIVTYAAYDLAPKERKDAALAKFNTIYQTQKKAFRRKQKGFVLGGGGGTPAGRTPPGHVRVAEATSAN